MKATIIYWSGMGNTKMMAEAFYEQLQTKYDTSIYFVSEFDQDITEYDLILFGCPSMGAEELEDIEFEPFFMNVEHQLSGKNVFLFGSYGWGNGEWMDEWSSRCQQNNMNVLGTHIINETPTDDQLQECKEIISEY